MLKTLNSKSGQRLARPWGGWLRAAALTAGVAVAPTAHAQDAGVTTSVQQTGIVSVVNPTRSVTLRVTTSNTKQHWISHKDCVNDAELTFRINVTTPVTGKYIFAYVGKATTTTSTTVMDSCLYNVARNNPALCKPLTVDAKDKSGPIVVISAKQLNALFGIDSCGESAAAGDTTPLSLQFYFLLEPLARDLITNSENYAIYSGTGIDLWGPAAPTGVNPVSSDEALKVEFVGNSTDNDVAGYHIFIDDGTLTASTTSGGSTSISAGASSSTTTSGGAGGSASTSAGVGGGTSTGAGGGTSTSAGAGGAMSTGTGGAGGATSTSTVTSSAASGTGGVSSTTAATGGLSTGITGGAGGDQCNPSAAPACTPGSLILKSGEVPGEDVKHTEDSLTNTSTEGTVSGLVNGRAVVVAVAAFDEVGNTGVLSELSCGTPQPLDNILRVYKCNNGLAESGCGFCSVGVDRGNSFAALVSAGLFVLGFAARRSRRPRAERAAGGGR